MVGEVLQKTEAIRMSEISLILDDYSDLFSDFDPRPYSIRRLSDDFIAEAHKAYNDKELGTQELKFMLQHNKRNVHNEGIIIKRLKSHFKRSHHIFEGEYRSTMKKGALFVIAGIILMFTAVFILFQYGGDKFMSSFMIVLFEPAGWFFFWEGLNLMIFESKIKKPEFKFYEAMAKAKISFAGY